MSAKLKRRAGFPRPDKADLPYIRKTVALIKGIHRWLEIPHLGVKYYVRIWWQSENRAKATITKYSFEPPFTSREKFLLSWISNEDVLADSVDEVERTAEFREYDLDIKTFCQDVNVVERGKKDRDWFQDCILPFAEDVLRKKGIKNY